MILNPASYPSRDPPGIELQGFFENFRDFITTRLTARFEPGFPCVFDWYTYVKDELFFDPGNPYEYSPEFVAEDTLVLESLAHYEYFKDELFETQKLRLVTETVQCPICYLEFSSADEDKRELHIFRECLHVFCKVCIAEVASASIDNGKLDKVRCPATHCFSDGQKQCETQITELDLRKMSVSQDRIDKLAKFNVTQAVDKMDDMGWCPVSDCGKPADVVEEMNWGTCTECKFRFCT